MWGLMRRYKNWTKQQTGMTQEARAGMPTRHKEGWGTITDELTTRRGRNRRDYTKEGKQTGETRHSPKKAVKQTKIRGTKFDSLIEKLKIKWKTVLTEISALTGTCSKPFKPEHLYISFESRNVTLFSEMIPIMIVITVKQTLSSPRLKCAQQLLRWACPAASRKVHII